MGKKKDKRKAKRPQLTARNADKFSLYEQSVQDPDFDIRFIRRVYRKKTGDDPRILREDFCGTAKLVAAWVKKNKDHRAYGLDLDRPTLAYGQRAHIDPLGEEAARRARLLERNVLDGLEQAADVIVAFNFSYCVFQQRRDLLAYLTKARKGLAKGGAMFLDIHGGPEAQIAVTERKRMKGFTYVWEQKPMDALSAHGMRYIHFEFRDGSKKMRAFTYDWRVWTLPELQDLLNDAGFSQVDVYWEGADEDGSGNGVFRRVRQAENEDSWIAYVVAWR